MSKMFICTNCKGDLEENINNFSCLKCNKSFLKNENYIDFLPNEKLSDVNYLKRELKDLNNEIKIVGYDQAIKKKIQDQNFRLEIEDVKSADTIFHGLNKKNIKCLEIGSNLGKNIDNLSYIFKEIFSVEISLEKIEFQRYRFNDKSAKNIKIVRCNPLNLPFPNEYFDLVLCNNVFEYCKIFEPKSNRKNVERKFLDEIKRVLNDNGCLCLGVHSKENFSKILGIKDELYENNKDKIFRYSLEDYKKILDERNFNYKVYWVLPSIERPYYSCNVKKSIPTKWFFKNISNFLLINKKSKTKKILFSIFKKLNDYSIDFFNKKIISSYIFCCYKTDFSDSIEDMMINQTKNENFLMLSRRTRIINILFEEEQPKKIISFDRFGDEIPDKIIEVERKFPKMKDPKDRFWMEDWSKGIGLDPFDINQVKIAVSGLHEFQNKTKNGILSVEFIEKNELKWIYDETIKIKEIDHGKIKCWLEEYIQFIEKNKIFKSAIHGDYWQSNILIEPISNKVNIIDWETFVKNGNPLHDNIYFLLKFMTKDSINLVDSLKEYFENKKKMGILISLKSQMNKHFSFEFEIVLLLRWIVIKKLIMSHIYENKKAFKINQEILQYLENKSEKDLK